MFYFEVKVQFGNNLRHNNYEEKSGKTRKLNLNNGFILFMWCLNIMFKKMYNISLKSEL